MVQWDENALNMFNSYTSCLCSSCLPNRSDRDNTDCKTFASMQNNILGEICDFSNAELCAALGKPYISPQIRFHVDSSGSSVNKGDSKCQYQRP